MNHGSLTVGKWLGQTVYVHRNALKLLPAKHRELATMALECSTEEQVSNFNVIKVDLREGRVSLLTYSHFRTDPFPALAVSVTVGGQGRNRRVRRYSASRNPPILHRKELLLPPDDPDREQFARLTDALERLAMYRNPQSIGFRNQWAKRLTAAGLRIEDHRVIEIPDNPISKERQPW